MAVEVERLLVSLEARITQFEKNMDRAAAKSRRTTAAIEADANRMSARVTASFAKAGAVLGGSLKAGVAGLAAGAIGAFSIEGVAKSIADLAKLQDVADRTGVSTKAIQEFGYAVEQSGGEIEDAYAGLQKFAVNLSKAGQGGGDLAKILTANNVALRDQGGALRPVNDLLGDVAELIRNATSEQDKLNIATAAFGKGAASGLVLALDSGRSGLAGFAADAQKAGLVLDASVIRKAAELDDQIAKTTRQIDGIGKKLIVEFAGPAIATGLQATLDKLTEINSVIEAIRNADFGKIGAFLMSRTGPGFLLGQMTPAGSEEERAGLEKKAEDLRARISALSKLPDGAAGKLPLDYLNKQLADVEERIKRINANPLKPVDPSATTLEPIEVEGRRTVLPATGDSPFADGEELATFVRRLISAESGGKANAKNPNSSATGVGQFIESTWLDLFRKYYPDQAAGMGREAILALRRDADISKRLIEAYAKENAEVLRNSGVAVTQASLQLAHFLGAGDAAKVYKAASGTPLKGLISDASIAANPTILGGGKTVDSAIAYANRRATGTRLAAGDLTEGEEKARDSAKDYQASLRESDGRVAGLQREAEALNQTAYARAFAAEKARLLADIEREGVTATADQVAAINGKAAAYARQSQALDQLERVSQSVRDAQQELGEIGAEAVKGFVGDLKSGVSAADALRNALDRILSRLTDNLIDGLFSGLFGGGKGAGGGGGGGILGSLLGGLFGGARAGGGDVQAGKAYVVGEKRAELFVPGRSGTIVPKIPAMPRVPAARPSAAANLVQVVARVEASPYFDARVDQRSKRVAAPIGREAYERSVDTAAKSFPARSRQLQRLGR